MASPIAGTTASSERMNRHRRRQRALDLAAQEAAAGHLSGRIEAMLARNGYGDVFADRAELAAAAQNQWWLHLLGRLNSLPDDDPAVVAGVVMTAAVRQAWRTTVRDLPGYLALAASAAGETVVRQGTLRYARMLALLTGLATVDDDPIVAARAGLKLVEHVSTSASSTTATAGAVTRVAPMTPAGAVTSALFRPLRGVRPAISLTTG